METIEKRLEYHELLMIYENTVKVKHYPLPEGYHFEFYKPGDEYEWSKIHVLSGENAKITKSLQHFHDFFGHFKDELPKRCFFITTDTGEKVATATISLLKEKEDGYEAAVDWVAIKKEHQGKHLARPLISRFIELANELGHNKLILHTQTHTWLAAKLYLDFNFIPYKINENIKGWQILKTITNHPKLENIKAIPKNEMYFSTAIKIYDKLKELHGNDFIYEIRHKNGNHSVYVNDYKKYYEYQYYDEDIFRLEKIKEESL